MLTRHQGMEVPTDEFSSPMPGRSTLMTSAPISPNIIAQYRFPPSAVTGSRTWIPSNGLKVIYAFFLLMVIGVLLKRIRWQRFASPGLSTRSPERISRLNQLMDFLCSLVDQCPTRVTKIAFHRIFIAIAVCAVNLYRVGPQLGRRSGSSST